MLQESTDENSLSDEQLETILIDSDDEITIIGDTPLKLAEGYQLDIKLIDTNGMSLDLTKNGEVMDSEIRSPSKPGATMADKIY
jgi:hypothetical protein